jgi:hypothetical protein
MKFKIFAFILLIVHCTLQIAKADWVQVNNGLTDWNVNTLCSYTSGGTNYLFAGTLEFPSSLFVSTNDGNNWQVSWQIPNDVWALATTNGGGLNYVFAGTGNGMGYTTNNGTNWYSAGLPHWIYSAAASGNYVFAGCKWQSFDSGGVYKSTNYGVNWVQTTFPTFSFNDVNGLAINGNNVYAGSWSGIYVSTDLGGNWIHTTVSTTAPSFAINGNYIFAGGGGVWVSTNNGMNWTQTSLNTGTIGALLVYSNTIFAGGGVSGGGFLLSTNNGLTWINRSEGGVNVINNLCISNSYIFAGTSGGGVYRRSLSELVGLQIISIEIPKSLKLFQNYPNPFNTATVIRFQVSGYQDIKLLIYDILGQEVSTLVNNKLQPGTYEFEWNAANFPSGIYLGRLLADNKTIDIKKLVLNK